MYFCMVHFESKLLYDLLISMSSEERDQLSFGVIELDSNMVCVAYNRTESEFSGLSPSQVLGRAFFDTVAPCMNNNLVRGRLHQEGLDAVIHYSLSLRMAPTAVRLRLLTQNQSSNRFLIVEVPGAT